MEGNSAAEDQQGLFISKFADALREFLHFQNCEELIFAQACPSKLSKALQAELGAR